MPDAWREAFAFGDSKQMMPLGISGDQTQHLLWRLQSGEIPAAATTVFVLIGTNNLGAGMTAEQTVRGITAVVKWLLDHHPFSQTDIVVFGLLPRGLHKRSPSTTEFDGRIQQVNTAVQKFVARRAVPRLRFVDCGYVFREDGRQASVLKEELMPDFLHPSAEGVRLWGACTRDELTTSSGHALSG